MFSFESLGDHRNAIVLCSSCHKHFDRTSETGWVFLPTHLHWFLDWEERDFENRQTTFAQSGRILARGYPTAQNYEDYMRNTGALSGADDPGRGGLFDRYILASIFSPDAMETLHYKGLRIPGKHPRGPKRWHGCPMAAIYRGFVALGTPCPRLPEKEVEQLQKLQRLYMRELSYIHGLDQTQSSTVVGVPTQDAGSAPSTEHAGASQLLSVWPPREATVAIAGPTDRAGHSSGHDLDITTDVELDSAVDVRSETNQKGSRKRLSCSDGADGLGVTTELDGQRPITRAKRRKKHSFSSYSSEFDELGVHPDTWSFGPSSSSNSKAVLYTGREMCT